MVTVERVAGLVRGISPVVVDVLVVVVVGLLTGADAAVSYPGYEPAGPLTWVLLAVSLVALLGRRRWPVPVALTTGAACAGWALNGHVGELLNLPVIVALYTVAVQGDRRRTVVTAVVASALSGLVALTVGGRANPQGAPMLELVWPLVPLLLGEVVRTRAELLREYADRAERAEAEREAEAARRVRQERVRIARELHDIVAHTVTGMTVQAGLALDARESRPEVAAEAMRQVRASGRDAVRELRATLAVLREEPGSTAPTPRLADLDELVDRARADGLLVDLTREQAAGEGELPLVVELAAYRIVQEALTNVRRHSRARRVKVTVAGPPGRLLVEVADEGPERPPEHGARAAGFGLVGMRERAVAAGGELEHGPRPGGGFAVRAWLPVDGGRAATGPERGGAGG
ncbi:sensor histidine kinase [Streptomyces sp. XM4193]|uniref:sensor histidine kinase n=1 Tax=Streptomyces sp. XM4193 TaxID=2929782 RepID=UPI001FF8AA57|nr:sensor histidine kinase [Streptomyces sp. XM4193]MCK1794787.1 sensor histidine kinase [Streptomyces sp. XM4193]